MKISTILYLLLIPIWLVLMGYQHFIAGTVADYLTVGGIVILLFAIIWDFFG